MEIKVDKVIGTEPEFKMKNKTLEWVCIQTAKKHNISPYTVMRIMDFVFNWTSKLIEEGSNVCIKWDYIGKFRRKLNMKKKQDDNN